MEFKTVFKIPQEKSSAGILTFSFLLAIISSLKFKWTDFFIALISYFLFLLTFDYLFKNASNPLKINYMLVLFLDALPVFLAFLLVGTKVILGLLPSLVCIGLYFNCSLKRKGRSTKAIVIGSSIIAGFYYYFSSIFGVLTLERILIGFMFFIYNAAQVLYIESKLNFRYVNPAYPLVIFLTSFLVIIFLPFYFIVPLIEPLIKLSVNIFKNAKISKYEDINSLGVKEFARYVLFIFILSSVVLYSELLYK
ncbi:MAG: hypothetical protein ACP5LX_05080 [Nitrososphaeria archaeon]